VRFENQRKRGWNFAAILSALLAARVCAADDPPAPGKDPEPPSAAHRFWVDADYQQRWTKGNPLPPLVTSSPAGTPRSAAGVLPGAQVLFGGSDADNEGRHGARLGFGFWLHDDQRSALEASADWVGDNGGTGFSASSNGATFLARPFVDATSLAPSALLVAAPGLLSGSVSVNTFTQMLSVSGGVRRNWHRTQHWRIDAVGGYRYFQCRETLKVRQSSVVLGGPFPVGTTIAGADDFNAKNDFHGVETGIAAAWNQGKWSGEVTGKVGLGVVRETSDINGDTSVAGGAPMIGDLLALSSNIGRRTNTAFAALPELRLAGGYALSRQVRLTLGYTVRYLSDALRTSGQIDQTVNTGLLPPGVPGGPARPQPEMRSSGLWSHGLNAGITFHF
jgi:hypothetical protein